MPGISLNDVMVDLQKSSVSLQMGVQVRNKLVAAYQGHHEYAGLVIQSRRNCFLQTAMLTLAVLSIYGDNGKKIARLCIDF